MDLSVLSRFDLVFLHLDEPDARGDVVQSRHLLRIQTGKFATSKDVLCDETISLERTRSGSPLLSEIGIRSRGVRRMRNFEDGLFMTPFEKENLLPLSLMQTYLSYVATSIRPKLSSEACRELEAYYFELKSKGNTKSISFTARHLETLIKCFVSHRSH